MNAFDPDGRIVKPEDNSLEIIINTLPKEEQQYVQLDDNGYIDKDQMSLCNSSSNNFSSLKTLVNSTYMIKVTTKSQTEYMNDGRIMKEDFKPVEIDEDFKDIHFISPIGNTTGETGNLGVTYMPTNGDQGKAPIDNNSIHININPTLSASGAAETFSHEGYGHAYIFVKTNGNRLAAVHHYNGNKDTNTELKRLSIIARKETIKNLKK